MHQLALDEVNVPFFPKLLLFDFDGTLFNTIDSIRFSLEHTFQSFSDPVPPPELVDQVISQGVGLRATLARLHPKSLCHDEIEKRVVHYRAVYQREGWLRSYPFPDIQAVLERAARSNVSLGVVSNKSAELIHRALTRAELREYFQLIVGDGVTPHSKPDVRLFTDHIATLPSCPEVHEVLMIGDAAPDILFASSVGCISCWASYGYGDQKSCRGLEPDYTVHTPSELLQFVR